jgi:hypothetical protein
MELQDEYLNKTDEEMKEILRGLADDAKASYEEAKENAKRASFKKKAVKL